MATADNSCYILAERVVTPDEELRRHMVHVSNGQIEGVGPVDMFPGVEPDFAAQYLIPGMIDLHVNGAGGGDAALGTAEDLRKISVTLAAHGCTAFQPTIITGHKADLIHSLEMLSDVLEEPYPGAKPLGIHLEGPFLNPAKRGVHRLECVQSPSKAVFDDYLAASQGRMAMLTVAPEMPGAIDLIRHSRKRLPVVSLGHTNASYECTLEAMTAGANLITHLFNATTPIHHREPGLSAAAMIRPGITVELIADGIHIHPEMVRLLFRAKGSREIVLVTDAISAAGMPDGVYVLGNLEAYVQDGVCRDSEGRLAGSTLQMDVGLRLLNDWIVEAGEADLSGIVATATSQPAQLLGLNRKGRIQPGHDADLVLMDEDLNVLRTWVQGRLVYEASTG